MSVYNRLSLLELLKVWLGLPKRFLRTRCHSFCPTIFATILTSTNTTASV